ncbi:Drug/metabolite transporter [Corchorus olitorius]|uniref:Drug/metabolite transporter n=2 Tax=Corchorus olitorius TaxID=93759 RepID=A0A1R3IM31_9ROSI|nr:Drug/metabolite transporter [Corchorus olitorius]
MGKKRVCDPSEGVKPVIIMLMAEAVVAGANIFYKLAVIDGMSNGVLASYKFLFSTAFLLPLALIFERGPLTLNLFIETMALTSVTFATAMSNLIPAVTFIFVVTLRMERLAIRTMAGKAKLVGSVLSLGGAMILTFYKGKEINFGSTNINLAKHEADHHVNKTHALLGNQVLGSMLGLAYCLSFSIWNIVHGKLSEIYPYKYSCTALMSITASIQSIIYAIIRERNWSEWKLGWNIRLLSSFYTGAICSGLTVVVFTWCIQVKGTFFMSIFSPCTLVYVFIFGYLFLNERLHIGSILGSLIITIGLYVILWGKAKETKSSTQGQKEGDEFEAVENRPSGMSMQVLISYRFIFASAFLLPLAFIFERGALGQNLFIGSLALTSATFATAMSNLIPAVTFLLLLILSPLKVGEIGNEDISRDGKAASIQATVYALITERNWSAWKLGWNIRLFTAFYTGTISTGLMIVVLAWCIRLRGPLFVSIFNPFTLIYVAVAGFLILNERLHLGSILGSLLIMGGVYVALWGKAKEMKNPQQPAATPLEHEDVEGVKAVMIMLGIQAVLAGVSVLYKLAINQGMSMQVLIAYRFIFASAFLLPLAFILERKNEAKLTWRIVFQGFLSGLFGGALGQNLFIGSLALTSATFAQAMSNLIPAVTFLLLLIFRLERLEMRTSAGMGKLVGTVISIVGAMILTFYKGPRICVCSTNINLDDHHENHRINTHLSLGSQVLGSFLALLSCFSFALWFIIQAKMNKNYPFIYSSTALLCISASIQSTIYALITERNWSAWKLGWNIRLLTAFYSGTISTGLIMVATTWCIRLKGPLFVSIFGPLALIYVAIAGTLVLNETLHLGSILGSLLIMGGVYVALWGKAKEMKNPALSAATVPLESEALESE